MARCGKDRRRLDHSPPPGAVQRPCGFGGFHRGRAGPCTRFDARYGKGSGYAPGLLHHPGPAADAVSWRRDPAAADGGSALAVAAAGLEFQNPLVLAAGTAAYGRELADVLDLNSLGGIVTKAVSVEPRSGARAPRVAEFAGGMINAVGLANPGLGEVRRVHLPWLAEH